MAKNLIHFAFVDGPRLCEGWGGELPPFVAGRFTYCGKCTQRLKGMLGGCVVEDRHLHPAAATAPAAPIVPWVSRP
jgi:hypothetical protein